MDGDRNNFNNSNYDDKNDAPTGSLRNAVLAKPEPVTFSSSPTASSYHHPHIIVSTDHNPASHFSSFFQELDEMHRSLMSSFFGPSDSHIAITSPFDQTTQNAPTFFQSYSTMRRVHPDGSSEVEETRMLPDGSKEITVTTCTNENVCETVKRVLNAAHSQIPIQPQLTKDGDKNKFVDDGKDDYSRIDVVEINSRGSNPITRLWGRLFGREE